MGAAASAVKRVRQSMKDGKLITNEQLLRGACRMGDSHAVKELYDLGLDLNVPFPEGYTPAWYAAYYGHSELLTTLDELGVDLGAPCDRAGSTPLAWTRQRGHQEASDTLRTLLKPRASERGRWPVFHDEIGEYHHKIDHYKIKFRGKLATDN